MPVVADPSIDARVGLTIRRRFAVLLGVIVIALAAVVGLAMHGLTQVTDRAHVLYSDNLATLAADAEATRTISRVEQLDAAVGGRTDAEQRARAQELDADALPAASTAVNSLIQRHADDDPEELAHVTLVSRGWREFLRLHAVGTRDATGQSTSTEALAASHTLDPVLAELAQLAAREQRDATEAVGALDAGYRHSLSTLLELGGLAVLLALGAVLWLTRTVVPRVGAYSRYARIVAAGGAAEAIDPRGNDELDDLAKALDNLVGEQRRRADADARQAEFASMLQTSQDESEAHQLLLRHLSRSIDGVTTTVLYRNNSDDRLQAMTAVAEESPVAAGLVGAQPRSCLALRFGRRHERDADESQRASLLDCNVCGKVPSSTRCEPLPVGGEVIGSILVEHERPLGESAVACISDTVGQSAPVLANLRNLALAEFRANSDSLTGLANKRAAEDTLKRMVAQASRLVQPMALVLLDLDHFKHVNDRHGHSVGDEVLAAAGATLLNGLRGSDFAGRCGGEEFMVLLPGTDLQGAKVLAEKIRAGLANVRIPGTDDNLTGSLGVAVFPDHAGNAPDLMRAADRALYLAKGLGRDRVVGADALQSPAVPAPAAKD
jgi:diguanylate cyclase (GGDEF)-like protein